MNRLFCQLKKKERKPINLPEIPPDKLTLYYIWNTLQHKTPIWAWYSITDKDNLTAWLNMPGPFSDTFSMYRVEIDYLTKYVATFDEDRNLCMMLTEISLFNLDNVKTLLYGALSDAYKVFCDTKGYTELIPYYVHSVSTELIESVLENEQKMYVGEKYLL